jgi:hypothetical protein
MVWYGVQHTNVYRVFFYVLDLVDKCLSNNDIFALPSTTEEWRNVANDWSNINIKRKGNDLLPGTVLAGDGLVIKIQPVKQKELGKLELSSFRNRKGYGIIVQAFCDAYGMFRYFEASWPGATNDIIAYKQTSLYRMFESNQVGKEFHMVLDEAYASIGGLHHMTPFTRHQLHSAMHTDNSLYLRMKAFNHVLSSQRITIERAFGMLVRKWGILWKPLAFTLRHNMKIIMVCAKLHNFCRKYWITENVPANTNQNISQNSVNPNAITFINDSDFEFDNTDSNQQYETDDCRLEQILFERSTNTDTSESVAVSDQAIMADYYNNNPIDSVVYRAAVATQAKLEKTWHIFYCGHRYASSSDHSFTNV